MVDVPTVEVSDLVFKIVVSGPMGAGKTTFISTIAQKSLVAAETGPPDDDDADSSVGMDFATYAIPDPAGDIELRLYGMPGEERFRFMWELLAEGADGLVMVVDGRDPETWQEALSQIAVVRAVAAAPGIIAVNHQHDEATLATAAECFAESGLRVVACDAADEAGVADALLHVLAAALDRIEADHGPAKGSGAWL